jgi:NADPH2 dehydrogenase
VTILQIKRLREEDAFRARLDELGLDLPLDTDTSPGGPLAEPLAIPGTGRTAGNRFCVLPMEGWDGTPDGRPTDLVTRRWRRFGESGAKLVWGGEAVAVRHDGRANPNQLVVGDDLAGLREALVEAHVEHHDTADDLVVGLQLTHSGRWSRPDGKPAPRPAHAHPVLDARAPGAPLSDDELDQLSRDFVAAARTAADAGFDFVDVKACHGYLGHELLSGVDRPGPYGGDLAGRSRFLRTTIEAIQTEVPGLGVGVRLSAFDLVPFQPGPDGTGVPVDEPAAGRYAFGADHSGLGVDLTEPLALLDLLADLGVTLVCLTAGSPYYNPHVQRPAFFPPSDGYAPPEDPLVGVARLLQAAVDVKAARPELTVVGTGFSYLQEWLPAVARAMVGEGRMDSVGVGRMALSYPDLPADVLAGRPLDKRRLCRTFSDCTTAPRNGLVSGCWPLDDFYKQRPDRAVLAAAKKAGPRSGRS